MRDRESHSLKPEGLHLEKQHVPVLRQEILHFLDLKPEGIYVDATFGRGGYSEALLEAEKITVIAIDQDPAAQEAAALLKGRYKERFQMILGRFSNLKELLLAQGINKVNGVVFDLGVSSPQLDQAERGFSFKLDGPLDMRMSQEGIKAADLINTLSEKELADIFFYYGEERKARAIARLIVKVRAQKPIETTQQLASLIAQVVGAERPGFDPATRSFQALRIAVNDELNELKRGLDASEEVLKEGGRLVVVTFHSLEDRIVKTFLKERSLHSQGVSRHLPPIINARVPTFKLIEKKAVKPTLAEIK